MNDYLKSLSQSQRISFGVSILVIISLAVFLFWWTLKTNFVPLRDGLSSDQMGVAIRSLNEAEIKFQVDEVNSVLSVASDQMNQARVSLANLNVDHFPESGMELFDDVNYSMTEFSQKVNYKRAIQGELGRSISLLKEVKSARVHVTFVEKKLFTVTNSRPKASVIVTLESGAELSSQQISGIQQIVAAAIDNMESSDVTLVDNNGLTLVSRHSNDSQWFAANDRFEQKDNIERELTDKARNLLRNSFHIDKVGLSVAVTLNYDKVKSVVKGIDPNDKGVVVHRKEQKPVARTDDAKKSNNETSLIELKYSYRNISKETEFAVGEVENISIGVLIGSELSEEKLLVVKRVLIAGLGIDEKRGDVIAVEIYLPEVNSALNVNQLFDAITEKSVATGLNEQLSQETKSDVNHTVQVQTVAGIAETGSAVADIAEKKSSVSETTIAFVLIFLCVVIAVVWHFWPKHKLTEQQRLSVLSEVENWLELPAKQLQQTVQKKVEQEGVSRV